MLRFVVALAAIIISDLAVVATLVNAGLIYGIDVSQAYSESDYRCLKGQGVDFVIARAYRSVCAADPTAPGNLQNAKAAGMQGTDIYWFPCGESVSRMLQSILSNTPRGTFGKIWIDVESGGGWSSDTNANCQRIGEMIDAAQGAGLTVGIYSSVGEWGQVAGSCTIGADKGLPVWYARYNGVKDYSDWIPFGGWSASDIAIHQYSDNIGGLCGVSADADAIQTGGPAPGPAPGPNPVPPPPPPPSPSSGCLSFQPYLCPGPSSCQCTTGASCFMTKEARRKYNASNSIGGCAGTCRSVIHGECPGGTECMKAGGYC